jgi:glycosyltransferase involved in cell wall biosynthesis
MRIVFFTHYGKLYGANRSLVNLVEGLRTMGAEGIIFAPEKGELSDLCEKLGIACYISRFHTDVYYLRGLSWVKGVWRSLQNCWLLSDLTDFVGNLQPQIIYTNTSGLLIGERVAARLGIPHCWHIREFGEADYQQRFVGGRKRFLRALGRSQCVIAISEAVKCIALADCPVPVQVVYNGVMWQKEVTVPVPEKNGLFSFCLVGALQPAKGQQEALEAFHQIYQKYPGKCRLLLVGDGQPAYTRYLKNLSEEKGLSGAVVFTGYLSDPTACYQQSHVLLMCSPHEAMGRVTVEAMLHGLPVIGFAGGATPELVKDGKNGFLYHHTAELVNCMERCLLEPEATAQMGQAAQSWALERFTIEPYATAVHQLLSRISPRQ